MHRNKQFSFRVSNEERQAILNLAILLHRSQGDAVRYIVIRAVQGNSAKNEHLESTILIPEKLPE